jgi:hypothetical protein
MRILLNARDVTNLANNAPPLDLDAFDRYLRAGSHELVLSFSNFKALIGPTTDQDEFLRRIAPATQAFARLPHTYLRLVRRLELTEAATAFVGGREYRPRDVFTARFQLNHLSLVRPDLDRQITRDFWQGRLQYRQTPPRRYFHKSVAQLAQSSDIKVPRFTQFVEWLYQSPDRCPGFQLHHEAEKALLENYDISTASDSYLVDTVYDLPHALALPYVDAATFDDTLRQCCTLAAQALMARGLSANLEKRLYPNLSTLMAQNH